MSISSEITRISQNVANSLTAVASKGATVPSGSNSDDLPTLIASLPSTKTVTYNLTGGASASVTPTRAIEGQGFSLKLKAPAGYNLSGVTVTMGGVDITSSVFEYDETGEGGGSITIEDVPNATGTTLQITTDGSGGGGVSATEHTIHLEFSDSTDADIDVYYDDALIGTMITAYTPDTYGGKTVDTAQLDNVTWYTRPTESWETYYDGTIACYDNVATIPSLSDLYFAANETWRVTLDGTAYTVPTYYHATSNSYIIGNEDLLSDESASGLPFLAYNVGWGALYIQVRDAVDGVQHPFKLEKLVSS